MTGYLIKLEGDKGNERFKGPNYGVVYGTLSKAQRALKDRPGLTGRIVKVRINIIAERD